MENIEKLKEFIKNNNLEFNDGSGGDVNILALCGYACYIDAKYDDVYTAIAENNNESDLDSDLSAELKRVFDYASTHGYSKFWLKEEAKKQYKF